MTGRRSLGNRMRGGSAGPRRPLAFAAVGAVGFAVDAGVLTALVAGWGVDPYAARAVSFPCAVTATWYLNRRWTFAVPAGTVRLPRRTEYARYFGVQAVGAAINLGVFALTLFAAPVLAALPVVPLALGAGVALIFTYLASRHYAFQSGPQATETRG